MFNIYLQNKSIFNQISSLDRNFKNGVRKGLYDYGKVLRETSRLGIKNPPKTGKYYIYKNRRVQASAPHEFPANRSGNLRKSIGFQVTGFDKLEFGSRASINYPAYLEKGTGKMKPRAFLTKSIIINAKNAINIIDKSIKRESKIK